MALGDRHRRLPSNHWNAVPRPLVGFQIDISLQRGAQFPLGFDWALAARRCTHCIAGDHELEVEAKTDAQVVDFRMNLFFPTGSWVIGLLFELKEHDFACVPRCRLERGYTNGRAVGSRLVSTSKGTGMSVAGRGVPMVAALDALSAGKSFSNFELVEVYGRQNIEVSNADRADCGPLPVDPKLVNCDFDHHTSLDDF